MSLTCTITKSDLPIEFKWLHNNISLNEGDGISIGSVGKKMSSLVIENIQEYHIGQYTCIATNKAGTIAHSADLHVDGIIDLKLIFSY